MKNLKTFIQAVLIGFVLVLVLSKLGMKGNQLAHIHAITPYLHV